MTSQGAEKAITTSALIIAGVYTYRRLTEGTGKASGSKAAQLLGQGSPPSVGVFITAWGTAFLIMAVMAQASPGLGGSFAISAAVADVLANGQQLAADINGKVKPKKATGPVSPQLQPLLTSIQNQPALHWTPYAGLGALP